jgi:hypothetical protein
MIYSLSHNFLLIKNQKVGGTSLEVELSQVLPQDAIVTEIYPKNKNHQPRNDDGFYNHISYDEITKRIDVSNTKSYVFVRNPYLVVLSDFFHHQNMDGSQPFVDYDLLDSYIDDTMIASQHHLFTINGTIAATKVLRYENGITQEINPILQEHGIPQISINTYEKAYRPKHIFPKDVFKEHHINKIKKLWSWEFNNYYDSEFIP